MKLGHPFRCLLFAAMGASSQTRFYWLDWFRFLAASAVVASHSRSAIWNHYDQMQLNCKTWLTWIFFAGTHLGGEAVILFFVLSGFLVGGKVLERSLRRSFDVKAYIVDRASRIYAPLVPALIVSGIIGCVFFGQRFSLSDLLGNLVGLQGIHFRTFADDLPLWTLAYEIWFYVLGGLVATLILGKGPAKLFSLCGIVFVFTLFTRFQAALLFCWCIGAFGYFLALEGEVPLVVFIGGLGLAIFGLTFSQYIAAHHSSFGDFFASGRVAELIFSLGLAIIFAFVSKWVPSSQPMLWIEKSGGKFAAFSYTLYLTHLPILFLWLKFGPAKSATLDFRSVFLFTVECASCLLFAFVLYLPFEAQTHRIREWLKPFFNVPRPLASRVIEESSGQNSGPPSDKNALSLPKSVKN